MEKATESVVVAKKVVGEYRCTMKRRHTEKDNEAVYLEVTVSDNLHELLKEIACPDDGKRDFIYNVGVDGASGAKVQRYRAKEWFIRTVNANLGARDYLFTPEMVDKGETTVRFTDIKALYDFAERLKQSVKDIIEGWGAHNKFELNVTYKVK